ncbi:hypothetical protein H5410_050015 [Solanum commersonii]|uniref:Uncharacterized protein n=1 Tax=Solanum commersonii TaxID=4109 RepID=A0A9J5WWD5_SOLCO|nr:hypothetical protein H5410_050015 [Solanum commersonii]
MKSTLETPSEDLEVVSKAVLSTMPEKIETPSSFNFSIPPPEKSSSIPVSRVGETAEFFTPHTEVVTSPVLNSGEIFPCSPTLVLFGKESQNFEAQSIMKSTLEKPFKDLEIVSKVVSSTMSERTEELVAVQSLASLRGDMQPTLLEQELRSPEQVPHSVQPVFDQNSKSFDVDSEEEKEEDTLLVWRKKRVRGKNVVNMTISDLEAVDVVPEAKLDDKPNKSLKKEKGREKGKMMDSQTK